MYIDREGRVQFSKEEMRVITASLLILSNEMNKLEKCKEFKGVKAQFTFSLEDLKYIKDWFVELYNQCKEEAYIFLFKNAHKKLSLIYTTLYECSKNFEKYGVSNIGEVTEEALNIVLKAFDNLLSEFNNSCRKIKFKSH